mgnify:CR=1 FL=1
MEENIVLPEVVTAGFVTSAQLAIPTEKSHSKIIKHNNQLKNNPAFIGSYHLLVAKKSLRLMGMPKWKPIKISEIHLYSRY